MGGHLSFEQAGGADDVVEDVLADVCVDGGERVVEQVDVGALVEAARQADALLLAAAHVDALCTPADTVHQLPVRSGQGAVTLTFRMVLSGTSLNYVIFIGC